MSSRSRASQLRACILTFGGFGHERLVRFAAGIPELDELVPAPTTRFTIAAFAALFRPVALVEEVPIVCPVESTN